MKKIVLALGLGALLVPVLAFAAAAPRTILLPGGGCYVMYDLEWDDNMYDSYQTCTTGCNSVSVSGCGEMQSMSIHSSDGTPYEEPEL